MRNSKKKVCIACGLLLSLLGAGVVGAEEGKLLLAEKYFPDAEIVFARTFRGRLTDLAIASKSGNVAIASVLDNGEGYVYYYDSSGRLLWWFSNANTSFEKIWEIQLLVSDQGNTVMVNWIDGNDCENYETQVYDQDGLLLYKYKYSSEIPGMDLSPSGNYICLGGMRGILTQTGNPVRIALPDTNIWASPGYFEFLPGDEITCINVKKREKEPTAKEIEEYHRRSREMVDKIRGEEWKKLSKEEQQRIESEWVQFSKQFWGEPRETQFSIISIPDNKIRFTIDIGRGSMARVIQKEEDYYLIGIFNKDFGSYLCKYDTSGNLIWRRSIENRLHPQGIFTFNKVEEINENEILILYTEGYSMIWFLDKKAGEVLKRIKLGTKIASKSLFYFDDVLMLSGRKVGGEDPWEVWKYINQTLVWKLDNLEDLQYETLEQAMIFGSSDSRVAVVYESDNEIQTPQGPSCKDFRINILQRKNVELH